MKIQYLSNFELLGRFGKLVRTERKITHLVLECIAEIDSRRLYLDKAYPSIYEFLVEEFGYSSSAALRRIESARLLRDVPELAEKIESGAINLSQLSKVQQAVRAVQKLEDRKVDIAEKMELLSRIEYTTQQQTEVILCQALSLPVLVEDKQRMHRDESVTLTITFSKEQMDLLNKVQDLIAHAVPEKKWSEVMTYLAQKEIQRRTHVRPNKNSSDKITARSPLLKESKIGEVATRFGLAARMIFKICRFFARNTIVISIEKKVGLLLVHTRSGCRSLVASSSRNWSIVEYNLIARWVREFLPCSLQNHPSPFGMVPIWGHLKCWLNISY